jgi:hypothetical protein
MHPWKPNDIHDIDATGSTLPHCAIVLTDKAVASHAKRKLAERLDTIVLWPLRPASAFVIDSHCHAIAPLGSSGSDQD